MSITALILFTAFLTAVPWAIAQLAPRWMPKMQTPEAKSTYRKATAIGAAALALTAALLPTLAGLPFYAAIAAAITLDVKWYRFTHTPRGKSQLESARFWRELDQRAENAHYEGTTP